MFNFYYIRMIALNKIKNNILGFKTKQQPNKNINFCGLNSLSQDIFEQTPKTIFLKVYNPFTNSYSHDDIITALNKPQTFELKHNSCSIYEGIHLKLDYNPKRIDFILDKAKNEPIKTVILKATDNANSISYNFMSENLKKEYGYVSFSLHKSTDNIVFNELLQDRPEQGIIGPKIVIDYLQNWDDEKIGGIGYLADKLVVKYCLDNNLPINIVSVADRGSHLAHYLRGKRFLPLEEDSSSCNYYKEMFGETDVNKILEKASVSRSKNEKIELKIGFLPMYMPKELVAKYIKELSVYDR